MEIKEELIQLLKNHDADFVAVVDVSEQPRPIDLPVAIIIGIALSKQYLHSLYIGKEVRSDEFVRTERQTDYLAELAEDYLVEQGYEAFAQSEKNNSKMGFYDDDNKKTILPHKTVAVLGGIGWIGKSDLLVTPQYGSGLSMCTVLTNAPFSVKSATTMSPRCGECSICATICPEKLIHNQLWRPGMAREKIINIKGCCYCMKCMSHCPWTRKYAER